MSEDIKDREISEALLAISSRYLRQPIERGGRVILPYQALLHLDIADEAIRSIYVVCFLERLELWSTMYRNQKMEYVSDHLADLP